MTAFQAAWQAVLDRHAVLRTGFEWEGLRRPVQLVFARLRFIFRMDDWSDLPAVEQEQRREAFVRDDRKENFHLDRPPLLRVAIIRLQPDSFLFISSYHHILLDGWSLPQLEREVRVTYFAAVARQRPELWISRPYADYIAWLQRQDLSRSRDYFVSLLSGSPGPTPLPGHPACVAPAASPAPAFVRSPLSLTHAESQAVNRFARVSRLTLGTLIHAAWGMVLMQSSGRRDVTFGTTVSGRPADLAGVETILGLFINNLPVRLTITDRCSSHSVLAALQQQLTELRHHEMVSPLEIETLTHHAADGRLFDSLLVVENLPASLDEWAVSPSLRFTLLSSPIKTRYALTLVAIPGDQLRLSLIHDQARFSATVIEEMLTEMRRLLLAMAEGPDVTLESLLRPQVPAAPRPSQTSLPTSRSPESSNRILPRSTSEVRIAQAVQDVLGIPSIGVTDEFVSIGMTSVAVARLALRLSEMFGRRIPLIDIITHPTVARLAISLARQNGSDLDGQLLVPMGGDRRPGDTRPVFYCVHPIAGDVSVFFDLARAMMPTRHFVALQAPGLRHGDPEPASLEALATLYVDALTNEATGPLDIGGYSFGGVVAFEIARQMERRGLPVRSVVILDTPAPTGEIAPDEGYSDAQWLWRMLQVRERFHGVNLALTPKDLERAGEHGSYDLVLTRLSEAGLLPENADVELLFRMASVGRRHYQLYRRYRPAPIQAPIAVIRASDVDASEAAIDHAGKFGQPDLGWAELTGGAVRTAVTPGNHITMMRSRNVGWLAAELEKLLVSMPRRNTNSMFEI